MLRKSPKRHAARYAIAAAALAAALPAPSLACRIYVQPRLADVRLADVVVVGRVAHYRIVRDEAFRRKMLALPGIDAEMRLIFEDPNKSLLPDYARFEVEVEEVLVGRAPKSLSVTWNNSTFGEPDRLGPGPYLIALRHPDSPAPPLRGPSGTIFPAPDEQTLTLLQAACSRAFLYEVSSEEGRAVREILDADGQ